MINRFIGVGRLTKDPLISATNNGKVARFSLAINRMASKGKESQTDFIDCVMFGEQVNYLEQYIKKGYLVGVDGKLQSYSYKDNNGATKSGMTVYVTQFQNYQAREFNNNQGSATVNNSYQPTVDDSSNPYSNSGEDYSSSLGIDADSLPF